MYKKIALGLISFILTGLTVYVIAQPASIGLGWAQNSVNAPVFRKNSVASFNGVQYVAFYDSTGHVILAKRELGTDTWDTSKTQYTGNINDAHCSISIAVDGDGFLHMAWDHHNNELRYCRSVDSGSLKLGGKTVMIGNSENDVTYPEFFRLPDGNLIFMYRYGVSGAGNMVINKYILAEKKWVRLHNVLIDGQGQRNAYWQSCVDKEGTIHVSWVWRETWDVATNHDLCYAKSTDGGETWYKSTGEQYTIPITLATAEYASKIPQKRELINQTSIYADSYGRPYIASYWRPDGSLIPQYHLVYLNDSAKWVTLQITDRKKAFSLSGGGTKKIPISRPQVMVDDRHEKPVIYLVYRDVERNSKVSVNVCRDLDSNQWLIYDLTDFTVNSWEPSYDTDLWKDSAQLNIYVQRVGQGDGETLENLPAQPVYILGFDSSLVPSDTIIFKEDPVIIESILDNNHNYRFIYPNPASDEVVINSQFSNVRLNIFDLKGNNIHSEWVKQFPLNLDVTYFARGIYIVQLYSEEMNKTGKFVKNRD